MTQEQVEDIRWYIIHAYSGQEDRVKKNLDQRIQTMDVSDKIFQVVVPTEEEMEYKDGQKKSVSRKVFPGYILVQMEMDDESWFVVRNTPGVTGFVSAEDESDNRPKPVPLEQHEVDNILNQIESDEPRVRVGFAQGQTVRITEGPFVDFMGAVDEVYPDRAKVKYWFRFLAGKHLLNWTFYRSKKHSRIGDYIY